MSRLARPVARLALVAVLGAAAAAAGWMSSATAGGPPAPVPARTAEADPSWNALTAAQRQALAPLQAEWRTLDSERKAKWLVVARRFPSMQEADRQRVQARMAEWARMTPLERGRARQNFQELRSLRSDDRHALWEAYRALPDERRRELAGRAPAAPNGASGPATADPKAPATATAKRNIVRPVPQPQAKAVTPTVVQAKPGATTTLVNTPAASPMHHQAGLPKITATEGFVNPNTLLPRRGPQGAAATRTASPASAAPGTP